VSIEIDDSAPSMLWSQAQDRRLKVTVRLWRPVGRFGEGELRCPPLALRKLDRGTRIPHS